MPSGLSSRTSTRVTKAKSQINAVKSIGKRMREARELCGLSLSVAANRFGYSNPSKLSKVEGATDTNSVPLWLIAEASIIYEVSIDYLFGVTDDWETGARMTQERDVSQWLFDAWDKARSRDMAVLKTMHSDVELMDKITRLTLDHLEHIDAALQRYVELNPQFEDQRGGVRLSSSISDATGHAKESRRQMERFRGKCKMRSTADNQMTLCLVPAEEVTNGSAA